MITFNIIGHQGRLGNQMFQYAALLSIANLNGYDYGIPLRNEETDSRKRLHLKDAFNLSAKDSTHIQYPVVYEPSYNFCRAMLFVNDNVDICGYFQSELYFYNRKELIFKEYTFKTHILETAKSLRAKISSPVISVHFRYGDYTVLSDKHPPCEYEYYEQALSVMPPNVLILGFSDDYRLAKEMLDRLGRPYRLNMSYEFVHVNNDLVDMCLMTMCDYHVIANSSFSWWGAYLSKSKLVIAPSRWFGACVEPPSWPKDSKNVHCDGWFVI